MLTQKLALSYVSKLILQFVQMMTSFIVARIVGAEVLGVLAYGLAYVNMFHFIADMGTGSAYIKLYNSGYDKTKCLGTYIRIRLILLVAFIIAVSGSYFGGKKGFHLDPNSFSTQDYVVLIYLAINIVGLLYSAFTATWMARTEQAKTDIPQFLQTLLYQMFRLGLALLGYRAVAIATSNLLAVIIVAPLYFYLGRDLGVGKFDRSLALKMIGISLPISMIVVFRTLFHTVDKVLLKQFSNATTLGYYSVASTFAFFIRSIEQSAGLLFFPFLSKAITDNKTQLINDSIKKFETFTYAFILPGVLLVCIMADKVIALTYGNKFLASVNILQVTVVTLFISLAVLPYGNVIVGKGFFYLGVACQGVAFAAFYLSALLFVKYGVISPKGEGMAIAVLIGTAVIALTFYYFSKRSLPDLRLLTGKHFLAYAVIFGLIMNGIYRSWIIRSGIALNLIFVIAYSGIYLLFGYLTKIIAGNEYALLFNVVNLKKMKRYINDEIMKRSKDS